MFTIDGGRVFVLTPQGSGLGPAGEYIDAIVPLRGPDSYAEDADTFDLASWGFSELVWWYVVEFSPQAQALNTYRVQLYPDLEKVVVLGPDGTEVANGTDLSNFTTVARVVGVPL